MPSYILRQEPMVVDPALVEGVRRRIMFGAEVECGLPYRVGDAGYHSGPTLRHAALPDSLDGLLKVGTDGSVHMNFPGMDHLTPYEIKYRYPAPLHSGGGTVWDLGKFLQGIGAKANTTCGFHVHVSLEGMTRDLYDIADHNRDAYRILLRTMSIGHVMSPALHGVAGRRARFDSRYTIPVFRNSPKLRELGTDIDFGEFEKMPQAAKAWRLPDVLRVLPGNHDASNASHYASLNFSNAASFDKGLYEARMFSGTVKPVKMFGYVCMACSLMHFGASAKGGFDFLPATEPEALHGKFREHLEKFFEVMGWEAGGLRLGLPPEFPPGLDLGDVMKEMRRLADKTDKLTPAEEESEEEDTPPEVPRHPRNPAPVVPESSGPTGPAGPVYANVLVRTHPGLANGLVHDLDLNSISFDALWNQLNPPPPPAEQEEVF